MRQIGPALKMLVFMTLLTGGVYPFVVTEAGHFFFANKTEGSLVYNKAGQLIGSRLVAQQFKNPKYFWPRPSAIGYNPLPSGGSNLGPTSVVLKKEFEARRKRLTHADPGVGEPPQDLLFASGSGLDPDISPQAAVYQVPRVAKARRMDSNKVLALVLQYIQRRQWRVFGEPRVNVLELNMALDKLNKQRSQKRESKK